MINKKQKGQISLAALSIVLIIVLLCFPGWDIGKILGIISIVLLFTSMVISYIEEEKNKSK